MSLRFRRLRKADLCHLVMECRKHIILCLLLLAAISSVAYNTSYFSDQQKQTELRSMQPKPASFLFSSRTNPNTSDGGASRPFSSSAPAIREDRTDNSSLQNNSADPNGAGYFRVSSRSWEHLLSNETFLAFIANQTRAIGPYVPINWIVLKAARRVRDEKGRELPLQISQRLVAGMITTGFGSRILTRTPKETTVEENGVQFRFSKPGHQNPGNGTRPEWQDLQMYVPFQNETFFEGQQGGRNMSEVAKKKIIVWYDKPRYWPQMPELEALRACPEFPCLITTNRKYMVASSAIAFAAIMITSPHPPVRRPDQIFIFHSHEPTTPDWSRHSVVQNLNWRPAFNWTMTYRQDSDIVDGYGLIRRRVVPLTKDYRAIAAKKTLMVAWMVSHCQTHSKREKYVQELRKYIQVDVLGSCGPLKCQRTTNDQCHEMIENTYRFYLSFENALCLDYITEKFFTYYSLNLLLIARGNSAYYKHIPAGTFINTEDFASPKDLAKSLLELAADEDKYVQMLQEKDKYLSIFEEYKLLNKQGEFHYVHYRYGSVPFCTVCQQLWNLHKYAKTVPDIGQWFNEGMCYQPTDLSAQEDGLV